MTIEENVPLAPRTTFRIGGPARWFVTVESVEQLREALEWARTRRLRTLILGGGSNLLIADRGFDGLVIDLRLRGIEQRQEGDQVIVRAAAGEEWDRLVAYAVEHDLAGFECLSGIPGSTGATPIQNVGAYGQEVAETIVSVEVLDRRDGSVRIMSNGECCFGYRASLFKNVEKDRYVVLAVEFAMARGGEPAIRYPELARWLEERHGEQRYSLQQVREAVIAIRRRKGMVLDPEDRDTYSAGSFFMNPILTEAEMAMLQARVAAEGLAGAGAEIPAYPVVGGGVKTSAAWLIERAGFTRGYGEGAVGLSSKHTLAIVNRGGGTAADVVRLLEEIRQGVRERFGVELHPEPNLVGFE
jgi:UDP-N-acetylmuramate dehydrogenase